MAAILYTSPFVPAEWISAYGLQPVRLYPAHAGDTPAIEQMPGLCPYARMMAHTCIQNTTANAVVIAATCDQMRRVAELIARRSSIDVFLMHIPVSWQSPASFNLYCEELSQLNLLEGEFELTVGGEARSLRVGTVATISPDTPHSGKAITAARILDVFHPVREDLR